MIKKDRILSIIPARSGSKGLPKKNIIPLLGKPLIAWTIEASLNSKYISNTLVSSDSDQILNLSKKFGSNILKRPNSIADDASSAESVVRHALKVLEGEKDFYDYIIYLQPTSPLRDEFHVDNAIKLLFEKNTDSVISVYDLNNKYLKLLIKNYDGYIRGISENKFFSKNRQVLPEAYMPNGAIYICRINSFLKYNGFLTKTTVPYLMSKELSIDVDNKDDLEKVEQYLKKTINDD